MKIFKTIITACLLLTVFSCKKDKVDMGNYNVERDSIIQENMIKAQQLDELNGILATIATGLDSISLQEHVLLSNKGRDGVMLDRQQIAANLKSMADILARQRVKIRSLQDSLARKRSTQGVERLQKVVEFLNQQLAEKDRVIQSLREDLNSSRKDITQFRASLSEMSVRADKAEKKTQVLTSALSAQDEIINECYIVSTE